METEKAGLKHPDWNITMSQMTLKYQNHQKLGTIQGISFNLTFRRDSWDHIMHFYLPTIILNTASVMSLYIPYDLWPARMSLCVTTCLSMITLIIGAK